MPISNTTESGTESEAAKTARPAQSSSGFAVIVLAAGNPPRGGQPGWYLGRSPVEHATRCALASGAKEVIVVAGEDHADVRRSLRKFRVRVVYNPRASEGIASSIRAGVTRLRTSPAVAVLSLSDQSKVTPAHLKSIAERALAANGPMVVASAYDGILGAPCAFAGDMLPRLAELTGLHGARQLIRQADAAVEAICFAEANHEVGSGDRFKPLLSLYQKSPLLNPYTDTRDARAPPIAGRVSLAV